MVPIAHASDGGGSIRNPASQCGLVGLKPSRARISLGPDIGEMWGGMIFEFILSRSVRDTAAMLDAVHGPMPGDPYGILPPDRPYSDEVGRDPGSLRIGLLSHYADFEVHSDCVEAVASAGHLLESLGHRVEASYPGEISRSDLTPHTVAVIASSQARAVEDFGRLIGRDLGPDDMDCDNWALTEMGRQVSGTQYLAAMQAHQDFRRSVAAWWTDGFDLLITPTISAPPPRIGEMVPDPAKPLEAFIRSGALLPFTVPFNITGQPAVSLPLHWNDAGLPIGLQLIAAMGREDLLIRVASQLEREVEWSERRPPIHA
jgi:amidase